MKVIPILVGTFWTILKGLVKGLEDLDIRGQVDTIQTTTFLRSIRIESFDETCCRSKFSEKPSGFVVVKNSQSSP